jgi:ribosomal protein S27E
MPTYSGVLHSEKQFYAYIHVKPTGVPFYVGKGHGTRAHKFSIRNPHHKNVVAKYGRSNILVKKIECSNEQIAFDLEAGLIKCLKNMGCILVNRTNGGEGSTGLVMSEEAKKQISVALTGRKGWAWTPETKAKVSIANKGKKRTPEQRAKMGRKNKIVTDETRRKLREAAYVFWAKRKQMLGTV